MNFTRNDMAIIVSMSIALIVMTFAFPAAGMVDEDNATENDIPEFDIDSSRFDFAGDFPESPGQPSKGTLEYDGSTSALGDDRQVWLEGGPDASPSTSLTLLDDVATHKNATIRLAHFPGGSTDKLVLEEPGDLGSIINESAGWRIEFEFVDRTNAGDENNVTLTVDYTITQQPSDTSWFDRIPILGGIFSAGEQLAGIVGWIGGIMFWTLGTIFEVALNLIGILLDVMVFLVATADWLIGTWTAITAGAGAWAKVFVAIPSILLFLEFAKLVAIGLSLLPTT